MDNNQLPSEFDLIVVGTGVIASNNFSWHDHVIALAKAVSQKLGFLFGAKRYFSPARIFSGELFDSWTIHRCRHSATEGMIESIVSAAASRVGKNVLHIDRADFYGGQWASFNLKNLHNFSPIKSGAYVDENLDCLPFGNDVFIIKNFQTHWNIRKTTETEPEDSRIENNEVTSTKTEEVGKTLEHGEKESSFENKEENLLQDISGPDDKNSMQHSQESLLNQSRKFNIDLFPKLHFARGDFVELIISSNIARYAEYRSVSRVLTWLNGQLEVVPCSRSDVFANNRVSVIEKRMLMKLLTSLDENTDNYEDEHMTFYQFLNSKKLSPNLTHYVLHAMSRSTKETTLSTGIKNTKRFLKSLGRFGKTPFLYSMYGSGETPQMFCRLSAVFGGVFALSQEKLSGLKFENHKATALVNGNQEIKADHFVLSSDTCPQKFVKSMEVKDYISRGILITDRSILPTEQEHLTLLVYPPEKEKHITTVIEMGSLTGTCPKNLFLVHLISRQVSNPQDDFQHIITNLFESENISGSNEGKSLKPNILWTCFYSVPDSSYLDLSTGLPENVYVCAGPDLDLDYDSNLTKAKDIFRTIYPDLDFLPRAPDPEEIVIGGDTSPEEPESIPTNPELNQIND